MDYDRRPRIASTPDYDLYTKSLNTALAQLHIALKEGYKAKASGNWADIQPSLMALAKMCYEVARGMLGLGLDVSSFTAARDKIRGAFKLWPFVNLQGLRLSSRTSTFGGGRVYRARSSRRALERQVQQTEKMVAVGLLAAGVAHEVNTPLTGISSYTQLLRSQMDPKDARIQWLDKIEKQTFRGARIVSNLLNFARAGGSDDASLDLTKVVGDVLSLVEHLLEGAKVRVIKELASDLPAVVGSENKIQQVLFNLILNARDAMPSGGWLTLKTGVDGRDVVVEVSDTGLGIPEADLPRIFDPFFTTKDVGQGTGLGLAVSYGIVQEHGGSIQASSSRGQGTRFEVRLPIERRAPLARAL